jgi:hypothetical protein
MSAELEQINAQLQQLNKALEAGNYNAAPSQLTQGSALQVEDLASALVNLCIDDSQFKLMSMIKVKPSKSTLTQFDRQLSYGSFGYGAQLEGGIGTERTSDYVRIVMPMCFYSQVRKVSLASTMVATVDGTASDDRAAKDATMSMAEEMEVDLFKGRAYFSNGGVFDANPNAMPTMANIFGIDVQIRQADSAINARDLNMDEFGGDESCIVPGGGTLTQDLIEDATLRSVLHNGDATKGVCSPTVLKNYNLIAYGKERIVLAGNPQGATGAELRKQWTANGQASLEASRFLEAKRKEKIGFNPEVAPITALSGASSMIGTVITSFSQNEVYKYFVVACNEKGEGSRSNIAQVTIANDGEGIQLSIPATTNARWFAVFRTVAGGTIPQFIGNVAAAPSGVTTFTDLNNRQPGASDMYMISEDVWEIRELAPYSRLKLAVADLSLPEAHFRFLTLVGHKPRVNTILENLK